VGIAVIVIVVLYMFRVPIGDKITALRNRYASMEEEISFPQEAYIALPPVLEKEMVVEDEGEAIQSSASSESEEEVPVLHLAPNCPLPVTSALNHHLLLELPATGRTSRSVATRLYLEQLGMLEVPQLVVTLNPSYMTLLAHFPHGWVAGSPTAKDTYLPQLQTIHLPKPEESQQERSSMRYAVVREDNARPFAHKMLKSGAQVVLDLSTYEDIALAGRVLVRILIGMREYALEHPVTSVITLTQARLWVPSTRVLQSGRGMFAGELARYMRDTVVSFITKDETPGFSLYLSTPSINDMDLRAVRGCSLWTLNRQPEEEDVPFLCHHAGLQEDDLEALANHSVLCDITTSQAMEVTLHRHRSSHSEPDPEQHAAGFFTGDLSSVLKEEDIASLGKSLAGDDVRALESNDVSSPAGQGTKAFSQAMLGYALCLRATGQLTRNALRRPPTQKTIVGTPVTFAELAHELGLKEAFSDKDVLSWDQTEALVTFVEQLGKDELQQGLQLVQGALAAIETRKMGGGDAEREALPEKVSGRVVQATTASRWVLPSLELFTQPLPGKTIERGEVRALARMLQGALDGFKVYGQVQEMVSVGPRVLRFHILPTGIPLMDEGEVVRDGSGIVYKNRTKIADFVRIKNDLQAALHARTLRMLDPIPGTPFIGVEIPNPKPVQVRIREILEDQAFRQARTRSKLVIALGRDISGNASFVDLNEASDPHLLVAGATGGGKSVCLNSICASILHQATPEDVRLLMIDPKQVELVAYNGIPHLIGPVVTEPDRASTSLRQIVTEMEKRYREFSRLGVRDLKGYNERREALLTTGDTSLRNLPAIVVIIDELAILMEMVGEAVEGLICQLSALGRAAGIHLIIATQRPSVDVITGLIKANITARIAFLVPDLVNSRVILDQGGAEFLQGKGDMLFLDPKVSGLARIQCALTEDQEVFALIDYWQQAQAHVKEEIGAIGSTEPQFVQGDSGLIGGDQSESTDPESNLESLIEAFLAGEVLPHNVNKLDNEKLYLFVKPWVGLQQEVSIQDLMFTFTLGQARAARLMQWLQHDGIVGPNPGAGRKRQVLANQGEIVEVETPVSQ
jgi:hypothetical protein